MDESGIAASSTFKVDYAKSSRSRCNYCRQEINEGELRMAPLVQSDKGDFKYPQWHHFSCFEGGFLKKQPGALISVASVSGLDVMRFEDQKKIKSLVVGGDSTLETKPLTLEEKAIAADSKLVWARKAKLEELDNSELIALLEFNNQPYKGKIFGGRSTMIDRIADGMVFGALPKCTVCHNGDFILSHGEYKCSGAMDEFARCENRVKDLERLSWKVPKELGNDYEFLRNYKFKRRERTAATVEGINPIVVESANPIEVGQKRKRQEPGEAPSIEHLPPFGGLAVTFAGRLSKLQKELESLITSNGGTVTKSVTSANICVTSSVEATGNGSQKGKDAVAKGLLCVSEDWIYESIKRGHRLPFSDVEPFVLANPKVTLTDSETATRLKVGEKLSLEAQAQAQRALLEEKYTDKVKSGKPPERKKLLVKGNGAVEPDSGLVETGHVYEPRPKEVFYSVMNNTDVTTGKNSFYILQIIEHDAKKKWSVFRKWGRLGDESIGGTKLTDYPMAAAAEREFRKVFFEKTGNDWDSRASFRKQPGKFMPIEIDFNVGSGGSETPLNNSYKGPLPRSTQELLALIFDIKAMNESLKEMEIDTQKMPLGKLSKQTIKEGFTALTQLQALVEGGTDLQSGLGRAQLVSLSNKFYNFIPHLPPEGGGALPLLASIDLIKEKVKLLSALQDLEIASKLISTSEVIEGEHPLDAHYKKLNTTLNEVAKSSDTFKLIDTYLQNTHGSTHTTYKLQLVDLWEVDRHGEAERYAPFQDDHNRMLLWHGSRLTNWGGILSQGLRIAPPEAPSTGYMFGKGVYFADMSSKSANYCFTTSEKNTGILMLCEVALGDMWEKKHAFFVDGLPKPYKSCKGVGKNHPDPAGSYVMPNGTTIPLGKGCASGVADTTLLYNEFIVYNVAQVRVRYLLRLNFQYSKKAGTFF